MGGPLGPADLTEATVDLYGADLTTQLHISYTAVLRTDHIPALARREQLA